jgi:uncharacterized membrane protein
MSTRLLNQWERLRSSLWFLPAIMTIGAVGLSFATIAVDNEVSEDTTSELWGIYAGGPDGARSLLLAIAGSMIGVAGVVFSITIVALSLASSQFGPRLLRNFMRDRANQFVLGTFIATFIYCLLVLRTVRISGEEFVPHVSVTVGIGLSLLSLAVLIYFIHHIASSIQAPSVIAAVANDLHGAIERIMSSDAGESEAAVPLPAENRSAVQSTKSGYVQAIDVEALVKLASVRDAVLQLRHRAGNFVTIGDDIAFVSPAVAVDGETAQEVEAAFILGDVRTLEQDIEFAIEQLVEVAVRALSPGINDPFTAMSCVDRLGAALCLIESKSFPPPVFVDGSGGLRIVQKPMTFEGVVDASFNQIRQHAIGNVAVTLRLLEALAAAGRCARRENERQVLRRHAEMLRRGFDKVPEANDRADLEKRYEKVIAVLDGVPRLEAH